MIPNSMQKKSTICIKLLLIVLIFLTLFFQKAMPDEIFNEGKKIFLENGNCGTCHVLSDAGSEGNIGPNLNQIRPDINRVIIAVTNGIGVMPAYEGILSTDEIKSVSYYVSESANK